MKFSEYELKKDKHGFEFAKNTIMKTEKLQMCMQCGSPTNFVEVLCEGYFCSDECVDDWYNYYQRCLTNMSE